MRVEPSVQRILVFFLAETAERKLAHGGVFAVVRQPFDYGESWSAVDASDEEVVEAWVVWVAEFPQAVAADGAVRRHHRT